MPPFLPVLALAVGASAPALDCTLYPSPLPELRVRGECRAVGWPAEPAWELGMRAGDAFVGDAFVTDRLAQPRGAQWVVSWRVDAGAMADAHRDVDVALRAGDAVIVNDCNLLLRPAEVPPDTRITVRVAGEVLLSAPWLPGGAPRTYTLSAAALEGGSYLVFGPQRALDVKVPGAPVSAVAVGRPGRAGDAALTTWVSRSAGMSARFGGGSLPVARTLVVVVPWAEQSDPGVFGSTLRWGLGSAVLFYGAEAPAESFAADWVAPHELFHLHNPDVVHRVPWFTEGFTTYYQDVLRARGGVRPPPVAWKGLLDGFRHGCATDQRTPLRAASADMRRNHDYRRVYWGGACTAFILDVALREHTDNRESLDTVYRALAAESRGPGGALDEAGVVERLRNALPADHWGRAWLHASLDGRAALPVGELASRLGVSVSGEQARFDDGAPWSHVRRAILEEPVPSPAPARRPATPPPPPR
ncbi:MAG: hypothetical protein HY904_25925 [Deltaproteobacteria bacterium]|nr:hypothetical protein [Deltaproteobacteria bacterium]